MSDQSACSVRAQVGCGEPLRASAYVRIVLEDLPSTLRWNRRKLIIGLNGPAIKTLGRWGAVFESFPLFQRCATGDGSALLTFLYIIGNL